MCDLGMEMAAKPSAEWTSGDFEKLGEYQGTSLMISLATQVLCNHERRPKSLEAEIIAASLQYIRKSKILTIIKSPEQIEAMLTQIQGSPPDEIGEEITPVLVPGLYDETHQSALRENKGTEENYWKVIKKFMTRFNADLWKRSKKYIKSRTKEELRRMVHEPKALMEMLRQEGIPVEFAPPFYTGPHRLGAFIPLCDRKRHHEKGSQRKGDGAKEGGSKKNGQEKGSQVDHHHTMTVRMEGFPLMFDAATHAPTEQMPINGSGTMKSYSDVITDSLYVVDNVVIPSPFTRVTTQEGGGMVSLVLHGTDRRKMEEAGKELWERVRDVLPDVNTSGVVLARSTAGDSTRRTQMGDAMDGIDDMEVVKEAEMGEFDPTNSSKAGEMPHTIDPFYPDPSHPNTDSRETDEHARKGLVTLTKPPTQVAATNPKRGDIVGDHQGVKFCEGVAGGAAKIPSQGATTDPKVGDIAGNHQGDQKFEGVAGGATKIPDQGANTSPKEGDSAGNHQGAQTSEDVAGGAAKIPDQGAQTSPKEGDFARNHQGAQKFEGVAGGAAKIPDKGANTTPDGGDIAGIHQGDQNFGGKAGGAAKNQNQRASGGKDESRGDQVHKGRAGGAKETSDQVAQREHREGKRWGSCDPLRDMEFLSWWKSGKLSEKDRIIELMQRVRPYLASVINEEGAMRAWDKLNVMSDPEISRVFSYAPAFWQFLDNLGVAPKQYRYGRNRHGSNVMVRLCIRVITMTDDFQFIKTPDEILVALLTRAQDMLWCNGHTMELVTPPDGRNRKDCLFGRGLRSPWIGLSQQS